jgi:hypothetical protein
VDDGCLCPPWSVSWEGFVDPLFLMLSSYILSLVGIILYCLLDVKGNAAGARKFRALRSKSETNSTDPNSNVLNWGDWASFWLMVLGIVVRILLWEFCAGV